MIKYCIDFSHLANYNLMEVSYLYIDRQMFMEIVSLKYHYLISINQNMVDRLQTLSLEFAKVGLSFNQFIAFCFNLLNLSYFGPLVIAG
jgi:hypothetical protein